MGRISRLAMALAILVATAAAGCGSGGAGSQVTLPPISSYRQTSTVPAGTGVSTTVAVTAVVPVNLVEDCLQYVELGAFVGIPEQRHAWDVAVQNETTQRATCTELGQHDPAALAAMSVAFHDLQAFLASVTTTTVRRRKPATTTTVDTPPDATPSPATPPPATPPPATIAAPADPPTTPAPG
jgi:hypothetical protein